MYCFILNENPLQLGEGKEGRRGRGGVLKGGGVRGEEGRGVEEKQGTYWTRDIC